MKKNWATRAIESYLYCDDHIFAQVHAEVVYPESGVLALVEWVARKVYAGAWTSGDSIADTLLRGALEHVNWKAIYNGLQEYEYGLMYNEHPY